MHSYIAISSASSFQTSAPLSWKKNIRLGTTCTTHITRSTHHAPSSLESQGPPLDRWIARTAEVDRALPPAVDVAGNLRRPSSTSWGVGRAPVYINVRVHDCLCLASQTFMDLGLHNWWKMDEPQFVEAPCHDPKHLLEGSMRQLLPCYPARHPSLPSVPRRAGLAGVLRMSGSKLARVKRLTWWTPAGDAVHVPRRAGNARFRPSRTAQLLLGPKGRCRTWPCRNFRYPRWCSRNFLNSCRTSLQDHPAAKVAAKGFSRNDDTRVIETEATKHWRAPSYPLCAMVLLKATFCGSLLSKKSYHRLSHLPLSEGQVSTTPSMVERC